MTDPQPALRSRKSLENGKIQFSIDSTPSFTKKRIDPVTLHELWFK